MRRNKHYQARVMRAALARAAKALKRVLPPGTDWRLFIKTEQNRARFMRAKGNFILSTRRKSAEELIEMRCSATYRAGHAGAYTGKKVVQDSYRYY